MLGVRSTGLLYPSGFARLAAHKQEYRPLAARVRRAWETGVVPLPSKIDFDNAIRLAEDAILASLVEPDDLRKNEIAMWKSEDVSLPNAGIEIRKRENFALYMGWRLGGVVVVWEKKCDGVWQLTSEDSGYLTKGSSGDRWLTRMPGSGSLVESSKNKVVLKANFQKSLHDELTPLRLFFS